MKKTQVISIAAVLTAFAIVLTFVAIPYPFVPWLEYDLSELIILFGVTMISIPGALMVAIVKFIIQLFTGSVSPYNIGEITALVASLTFLFSFAATKKLNTVVRLIIVSLVFTVVMLIFNFFIATPVYFGGTFNYRELYDYGIELSVFGIDFKIDDFSSYLKLIIVMYAPFNLMKAFTISLIYILIEKPVMRVYNVIFKK